MIAVVHYRVFDNRVVPLGAKHDTDSWIIGFCAYILLEIASIEIHLSDVLISQFPDFQINQHKAFEDEVIEYKIDIVVFVVGLETVLTRKNRAPTPTRIVAGCR